LTVQSDLKGIQVDLPKPLGKAPSDSMPFNMQLWLGAHLPPRTIIRYGQEFSAALDYHLTNNQLNLFSINLHLGVDNAAFQSTQGLYIDGRLKTLDWNYWKQFFEKMKQRLEDIEGHMPAQCRGVLLTKSGTQDLPILFLCWMRWIR